MSTIDKPRALVSGFFVATDFHALEELEVFIWQTTTNSPLTPEVRPYYGLINHWFPLLRPY